MYTNITEEFNIKASAIFFSDTYTEKKGAQLLAYWTDLKGERDRPTWGEFDFLDIIDIASVVIIKDVINHGEEFRNRFWGTRHVELDKFDGTGKLIAECYLPEDVPDILKLYSQPLLNPTPMIMQGTLQYQEIGKGREYASICVGFTDQGGTVTHLVCAYDM